MDFIDILRNQLLVGQAKRAQKNVADIGNPPISTPSYAIALPQADSAFLFFLPSFK